MVERIVHGDVHAVTRGNDYPDQWNHRWNLATPPDEKGFPSHLCFTRINLILD